MNTMIINRMESGITLKIADSWLSRLLGWMGKKIDPLEAIMLTPCNCIHTFGMREAIDVIFLNKSNEVIYTIHQLRPGKVTPKIKHAYSVIELKFATIEKLGIYPGQTIIIQPQYI